MNNERMIAVSSGLIERAISVLDLLPESGTIIELRAALATQPAAGEPVAWMTRPRKGSYEGREFLCQPDDSLNLDQWEKPFPVFTALPAAAPVAAGEPKGWRLVPIEPLLGMMSDKDHETRINSERTLLAMLDKAPPAAAHGDEYEIWSAAQLSPGEGIEDGAERIRALIEKPAAHGDEAVRKDAERFDWLISNVCMGSVGFGDWWMNADEPASEWRAAIDAAMRAQGDGEVK